MGRKRRPLLRFSIFFFFQFSSIKPVFAILMTHCHRNLELSRTATVTVADLRYNDYFDIRD